MANVNASAISPYKDAILASARKWGVDPVILGSIILHESGGTPGIQNNQGYPAYGLTQIFAPKHPEFSVAKLRGTDAASIAYQIDAGAQVLKKAMDAHPGNTTAALQAYAGSTYTGPQGQSFRDELLGSYTGPVSAVLGVNGGDFLSGVGNAVTGAVDAVTGGGLSSARQAVSSAGDAVSAVGTAVSWFAQPDNMLRLMIGLTGIAFIIGGLLLAASGTQSVREAAGVAQTAAVAAA